MYTFQGVDGEFTWPREHGGGEGEERRGENRGGKREIDVIALLVRFSQFTYTVFRGNS